MPFLSTPVSRRYTPPTCTLEITAQTSALSRWTGQRVLKQLQFQLSFEDPRRWGEPVQIRGDRRQFEALGEAVESYVQQLLSQRSTDLSAAPPAATEPQLEFPEPAVSRLDPLLAAPLSGSFDRIQLQPKSYLSHDLFLGPLTNETSGSVVNLSASGLFDLAAALEESTAEASTLPPQRSLRNPPLWTRVAAIAVLFVGVTTALQLSNNSAGPERTTGDYPAEVSQRPSEPGASPLPPPPNTALPPLQLPPVTVPPTPSSALPSPMLEVSPGQNQVAPNERSAVPTSVPTPKAPLPNITVQPKASSDDSALPTIPDLATPDAAESLSASENTASKAAQPSQTTFDGVPQVAEARSYFQKRWQPPQSLDQTLEYTLSLNSNGSIQQIIPLNQAAKTYLDRTPIPLRNEPFVSPIQGNPKIRLVLGADGAVKAFLQSAN